MAEAPKQRTVTVEAGLHRIEKQIDRDRPRETFIVKLDTPIEEVYKRDRDSYFLTWDIEPGTFRSLEESEWKKLTAPNQSVYNALARAAQRQIEMAGSPFKDLPRVIAPHQSGDAGRKLAMNKAIRGRVHGWKRPDELHAAQNRGWRKTSAKDGYSPNFGAQSASDGIYIKTQDGNSVDLVSMDIDERLYQAQLDEVSYRSQSRTKSHQEQVKDEAKEAGVKVFDVDPEEVDAIGSGGETPRSAQRRAAQRAEQAERAAQQE